jgi:hypothetical protein
MFRIFIGKPERKRLLGRHRRRWENNIEMDLREIGWGSMDWIDLAKDRDQWRALVNTVIEFWGILEFLYNWQLLKKGSAPWS